MLTISNRVTDRNRRYLSNFKPVVESPLLRGPRPDVCVTRVPVDTAAPVESRATPPVESTAFPPIPNVEHEERFAEAAHDVPEPSVAAPQAPAPVLPAPRSQTVSLAPCSLVRRSTETTTPSSPPPLTSQYDWPDLTPPISSSTTSLPARRSTRTARLSTRYLGSEYELGKFSAR